MTKICMNIIHEKWQLAFQSMFKWLSAMYCKLNVKISVQANQSSIGHFFQSWQLLIIAGGHHVVFVVRNVTDF